MPTHTTLLCSSLNICSFLPLWLSACSLLPGKTLLSPTFPVFKISLTLPVLSLPSLGWGSDPLTCHAVLYPCLLQPSSLSGNPLLEGFYLGTLIFNTVLCIDVCWIIWQTLKYYTEILIKSYYSILTSWDYVWLRVISWNIVLSVSSISQSCPTLCDPMDCSTPGLPVHHQLPELTQTHVHWVGDAIQPSHPLSSPSPPAFNLSQDQGLFQWFDFSHQVAKVLELQLQHQSFQWIFRVDFL